MTIAEWGLGYEEHLCGRARPPTHPSQGASLSQNRGCPHITPSSQSAQGIRAASPAVYSQECCKGGAGGRQLPSYELLRPVQLFESEPYEGLCAQPGGIDARTFGSLGGREWTWK